MQREAYLLELARYVVLNPVRAGICDLPETSALPHAAPCFRHSQARGQVLNSYFFSAESCGQSKFIALVFIHSEASNQPPAQGNRTQAAMK